MFLFIMGTLTGLSICLILLTIIHLTSHSYKNERKRKKRETRLKKHTLNTIKHTKVCENFGDVRRAALDYPVFKIDGDRFFINRIHVNDEFLHFRSTSKKSITLKVITWDRHYNIRKIDDSGQDIRYVKCKIESVRDVY